MEAQDTPTTEAPVKPAETTIRTVSVKVSRQVDLGYVPYIKYIRQLNGKNIPFGTRDQSRAELDVFVSAEVGTNDTPEAVIDRLSGMAHDMIDDIMRENYADAFREAASVEIPDEAFTIGRTTVERAIAGDY